MEINGVKIDKAVWRDAEKEHKKKNNEKIKSTEMAGKENWSFMPKPKIFASYLKTDLSEHLLNIIHNNSTSFDRLDKSKENIKVGNFDVSSAKFSEAELNWIKIEQEVQTPKRKKFLKETWS